MRSRRMLNTLGLLRMMSRCLARDEILGSKRYCIKETKQPLTALCITRCFGAALVLLGFTARLSSGAELVIAPEELRTAYESANPTLKLPLPSGTVRTFTFAPNGLLSINSGLGIRTLAGRAAEDNHCSADVVLTTNSLAAQVFSPEGTFYLNSSVTNSGALRLNHAFPANRAHLDYHCLTITEPIRASSAPVQGDYQNVLRTFRLAPAATAEYSGYFRTKDAAVREVVTAMSRANGIFTRELGIRFELVPGFEQMVFTNQFKDPYSANDPSETLLGEAQAAFDKHIGTENYDLGILLTRGQYGLAYFSSVGDPQRKGMSCIGLPKPTGEAFHVNLVTHELAHQFGAKHTFNSPTGFCAERRDGFTAFEPGAGSTLMSYSSLPCQGDSFQPNHDPYFHSQNLKQILDFVNGQLASWARTTPRRNTAPSVKAGRAYKIPVRTPFALTATGSDAEKNMIYYCWEQRDLGPARTLKASDDGTGPLFRSFPPTTCPTRFFPRLDMTLAGKDAPEERLPTVARKMQFRVTARDSGEDGAVGWSDTEVDVVDTGGSFRVTSHNSPGVIGGKITVQWDVAGTTNAPINAPLVSITLSTNGGQTFSVGLAASTANDGSQEISLPPIKAASVRIKVQPVDNIFFDINDAPLRIGTEM